MRALLPCICALAAFVAVPGSATAASSAADLQLDYGAAFAVCTPANTNRAAAKRTGPFGWLTRYSLEDEDLERTRFGAVISYYLRSPLLTSFLSIVPCPQPVEKRGDAPSPVVVVEECALLVIRDRDGDATIEVDLPFAGATTVARLRGIVSEHQARGEPLIVLQPYGELELAASAIRDVRGGCR